MYGGIFLLKSICIKLKNKNISEHLLKELEYFEIQDVCFSCYDFKYYTNIIIHYMGSNLELFLNKISSLLSYVVIDFYEPILMKNLINSNYFYFSTEEKKEIYNLCLTNIDFKNSISIFNSISNAFHSFFTNNKSVVLDGFVNFRLQDYLKELDSVVDICVNKFIIDREYNEFITLLRTYIQTSPSNSETVHLIYKNENSILLDDNRNTIKFNNDLINKKYLSDISFSSNDFALNSLLSLLPKKLYVHIIDKEDDFINTLKLIFNNRVFICNDCNLCNMYKYSKVKADN